MAKPNYTKPTSQLDLEERQKDGYVPGSVLQPGVDPDTSDNGYVGVDPIYQTFANETERPLLAEKGAESKVEKNFVSEEVDTTKAATPEGESEAKEQAEGDSTTTPTGSTTPPSGSTGTPPAPSNPSK